MAANGDSDLRIFYILSIFGRERERDMINSMILILLYLNNLNLEGTYEKKEDRTYVQKNLPDCSSSCELIMDLWMIRSCCNQIALSLELYWL
jgi:hypothetical protein